MPGFHIEQVMLKYLINRITGVVVVKDVMTDVILLAEAEAMFIKENIFKQQSWKNPPTHVTKEKKFPDKTGGGGRGPRTNSIYKYSLNRTEGVLEETETQEKRSVQESVSMNTTANGSSSWSRSRLINPVADKIGQTVAYNLIFLSYTDLPAGE